MLLFFRKKIYYIALVFYTKDYNMTYKSKIIAMLLILNIINNTHCGDGGKPMTIYQGLTITGAALLLNNVPSIFTSLKNNFFPTTVFTKNVIPNSITLTPDEIEFQKVQHFLNSTKLTAMDNGDHMNSDFNEFLELSHITTQKLYTTELSKVLLNCVQDDSKDPKSQYTHYSRCLKHANGLAKNKEIPQPEEPKKEQIPSTTDDDHNNHQN